MLNSSYRGSYVDNKPNRRGCRLLESNEDWQFENPIVSVGVDGEVKKTIDLTPIDVPIPKMRHISEFLADLEKSKCEIKEDDNVEFINLPMEKQIKLVADEYNAGRGPSEVQRRLGIKGDRTYYDRLDKARAIGLVAQVKQAAEVVAVPVSADGDISAPKLVATAEVATVGAGNSPKSQITTEDFAKVAAGKIKQAERLAKEADTLNQAAMIAQELTELLGDAAGDLVAGLYGKVTA